MLAVRDELDGLATPNGRQPIPSSPAGFPYPTQDIRDYSLYQLITIYIDNTEFLWDERAFGDCQLLIPSEELYAQQSGPVIHPDFYMDNSNHRFSYKWDYDYDGVTFNVDDGGLPSPLHEYTTGGRKNIGLRVRTNSVPPQEYIYTIPVFIQGEAYHKFLTPIATTKDSTFNRSNHSAHASKDKFYFVYTHKGSANSLVKLAVVDRVGNVQTYIVSDDLPGMAFYQPAIEIVDWGSTQGIWVSYTWYDDVNDSQILVTRLDMDGNFVSASRVSTAVNPDETSSLIVYNQNALHVYYVNYDLTGSKIYGSHSTNWGTSWVNDGWIAPNADPTPNQSEPTCAIENYHSNVYLIWTDYENSATRGSDLYLAFSDDGNDFDSYRNISTTLDSTAEYSASASNSWMQLSVAYLSNPPGSPPAHTRLMVINPADNYSIWDSPIQELADDTHTHYSPSISAPAYSTWSIAYTAKDNSTDELTTVVLQVYISGMAGTLQEWVEYDGSCGIAPAGISSTYPCIVSYQPNYSCVETFAVWRDITQGNEELSSLNLFFGQLDMLHYVDPQPD